MSNIIIPIENLAEILFDNSEEIPNDIYITFMDLLKKYQPRAIIHFAAQSHVQNSFTDAIQYTQDNIVGTHNLLEATRLHCPTLQKFIHVSTDEVYGESMLSADEQHKTEQTVLCPTNPYAATKAGAELLAQAYNHSFKMPITLLMPLLKSWNAVKSVKSIILAVMKVWNIAF